MEGAEGGAQVRRTRIPVTEFTAAIRMSSGQDIDADEVECLLANMIYKVSPLVGPPLLLDIASCKIIVKHAVPSLQV